MNVPENQLCEKNHTIVITGFGIFRDHELNPSWEAIKDEQFKINRPGINIITKQVNVSYEEVDKVVSELWNEYNPLLMVHIGLAAHESSMRIEQLARHGPYIHEDVLKYVPHRDLRLYDDEAGSHEENLVPREYGCKPCKFSFSKTSIDVEKICYKMNEAFLEGKVALPTKKSLDAGLYVCEYIYQKSLQICGRSIFIHVPDTKKFKIEDIRVALQNIIEILIDDLLSKNSSNLDISEKR